MVSRLSSGRQLSVFQSSVVRDPIVSRPRSNRQSSEFSIVSCPSSNPRSSEFQSSVVRVPIVRRPSSNRQSSEFRSGRFNRQSSEFRSSVGRVSIVSRPSSKRQSSKFWPSVVRVPIVSRPSLQSYPASLVLALRLPRVPRGCLGCPRVFGAPGYWVRSTLRIYNQEHFFALLALLGTPNHEIRGCSVKNGGGALLKWGIGFP